MTSTEPQRILKADALRGLSSRVAFNYDDLRRKGEEHIESVRRQARRMLQEAHAEAEQIRQRALVEARQAGQAEGLRDAETEIERRAAEQARRMADEKLETVLPALRAAAGTLSQERDRWLAAWESAAIELSVGIAEKLLRQQLHAHPERVVPRVREILELAAGSADIRVRLNPDDRDLLAEAAGEVVRSLSSCGDVAVTADPSITRGGCLVETRHGMIDARLETQLDRIAAELLQPDEH